MRRLRRLSLTRTTTRRASDHPEPNGDPCGCVAVPSQWPRAAAATPPLSESVRKHNLQEDDPVGSAVRMDTERSIDTCEETTTDGTATTNSHSGDCDEKSCQEAVSSETKRSHSSIIESIERLDALLMHRPRSSSENSQESTQHTTKPTSDRFGDPATEPSVHSNLEVRRACSGACEEDRRTALPATVHRMIRRMSGNGAGRQHPPHGHSDGANQCTLATERSNPSSSSRVFGFRGKPNQPPRRNVFQSFRRRSVEVVRRRSVGYSSSSDWHDRQRDSTSHRKFGSSVLGKGDAPPSWEASLERVPTDALLSVNNRADPDHWHTEDHASGAEGSCDGSIDSGCTSDAASDAVHYNTEAEVYNARRQATSPGRSISETRAVPLEWVSMIQVMSQETSSARRRSVCSLPTPQNEFGGSDAECDETISSASETSDMANYVIHFDNLVVLECKPSQNPQTAGRLRQRSRTPRLNDSFRSDTSSEVEESLKDSVIREHTLTKAMRPRPRRQSLGTASSASSEPEDSIVDSLADRATRQIRVVRPLPPSRVEAIGWAPTFVSPIKENRRRRLSLNNIPNALNDGSRGLPRFNSTRLLLSEDSEDTFAVENDDASEG